MADILDPAQRSELMSRIRNRDTKPELVVRRFLHAAGLRYRLHAADLPGTPDIVFRSRRVAIFVNGCFWHRHADCDLAYTPKSRVEFWTAKFEANVERDERVGRELEGMGWRHLTVWECEVREGDLDWLVHELRQE